MPKMRLPDPSKNNGEGVHAPVRCRKFAKLDTQKRRLSYCCLKSGLVTCLVKKPFPKSGCGKQKHTLLHMATSELRTEEPPRWSRDGKFEGVCSFIGAMFFTRPPVPDYRNQ
ncbi:hypothetical protein T11_1167 [Trichinella zimbabwensis]|uniref:Uncharacterized protein n=1 Tax=Trichinella zimbabwensis TaxID=268475 RepID=A0A0V1HWW2_9BILA|nr:hypothetical protein T11_1167 [Trichinella zimbabwensis]